VQLYTVRSLMETDVPGTLSQVAQIGYKEVEFHNYFGVAASEIARLLSENGLISPAMHVSPDAFDSSIGAAIEDAKTIGHHYLICAWIPEEKRQTLDDYRRYADSFNEWGAACNSAGLQFAYHNHDFEFVAVEDQLPYDLLLESCDPDLVKMELDLFWIRKAGLEPAPYFEKYPGRFELCHVKDMDPAGEMTEVGSGTIDFVSDFSYTEVAGLKHFFVEHDNAGDPMESIKTSFAGLSALL
jgi:sugar phosphate isomerase/epimerase